MPPGDNHEEKRMPVRLDMRRLGRFVLTCCLLLPAAPLAAQQAMQEAREQSQEQAQRQQTQPLNNAPVWRDVRSGEVSPYQTSQVRGVETTVLVQSQGEIWRQIRNGPITVYGGWLIVVAFLGAALFFWWKGPIKLHGQPTGRTIERFTPFERLLHWTTAISFVILAVSGIVMLFGRYVLLPMFGYTLFSWLAILSKNLHNFVGPLFVVCTVIMFFWFVRDNLPRAYDWVWVRKFGGLFTGEHVPSGKFNAGEKGWFWIGVTLLGIVVSVTGLVLDFPNFAQGRETMQQANVIHAIAGVLFMVMSLGHIYLGTIGQEGSYDSMRHGHVDETWAKEHHEYWYNEVKGQQARPAGGTAAAAHAAPVKEGWKL
jgi:formate dehydrogenase subunit gamma